MTVTATPTAPPAAPPASPSATPARPSARARQFDGLGPAVDIALTLVTCSVAVALVRAFRTWDELWPLLTIVLLAHGLSTLLRYLRVGATLATALLLVVGAVAITAVYYRHLSWFGLPNADVVSQAVSDAHTAFGPFQKLVAPVDALPGFTIAFAIGLWLIALFADLAAGRSDAPMQAVAPHVAVFTFSSVLLLGRHAVFATVLFIGALALYRLAVRDARVRRAVRDGANGTGVLWTAGVPIVVVVLLAGAVFSGVAPTERGGVVDLRSLGRGPDARVVESPLVSLDSLLGQRSNTVLFTVESDTPHYWRLTALDDFDGRSWSASAKYHDLDSGEEIPSAWDSDVPVQEERFQVTLTDLLSDWLPSVYAPTAVDAPIGLRYDDASSSVFVADGESSEDISYDLTAEIAQPELGNMQRSGSGVGELFDDFLKLPSSFSEEVARTARDLTTGLGAFEKAAALERFFHTDRFVYDRDANYREANDPLEEFLRQGNGFCQQFATAFAAMARSVGLPSRVAVGFTYGEPRTTVDSSNTEVTTWTVRGRYAHAWPEVYIAGTGWVAFEPTPGRGNPDATTYSSAETAQSSPVDSSESVGLDETLTPPTTTTTLPLDGVPVPTTLPDQQPERPAGASGSTTDDDQSNGPLIVLAAIAGLALLVVGVIRLRIVSVRRRRQHRRSGGRGGSGVSPAERVAASWRQACRDLARVDVRSVPAETPTEFAHRAGRIVEVESLTALAHHESDRRFRRAPLDETEAQHAEELSDELRKVVWSRLDRRQRLAAEMDVGAKD